MAQSWLGKFFSRKEEINDTPLIEMIEDDLGSTTQKALEQIKKDAMSYNINPYDIANSEMMSSVSDSQGKMYYLETYDDGRVSYKTLETLSRHPLVSSIVQTRVNQVAEFAQFTDDEDLGFKIVLRDRSKEPTKEEREGMKKMIRFLQNCGKETLDFELTFEQFIRQIVRDSLVYDQCCFEIVRNKREEIIGFLPVDASTIRRSKITEEERKSGRRNPDNTAYIQVVNDRVVAEFKQRDLCFGVRRPRTNITSKKYGFPELEELIQVLGDLRSAEIYNASNFNNGISANGIIAIKSKMDPKLFRAFRREFYQMLTGVNNSKRTPLIQLDPETNEDVRSINLSHSNKEMEYNNWISYLIKVLCSVYQMDPAEIGFVFGSEGQSSALIQSDPTARIIMGKEKGLRPLVRSIQSWINKYIIWQLDDRFELEFVGLESVPTRLRVELEEHRMKYMTINEIRASHDLPEIDDGHYIADHFARVKAAETIAESRTSAAEVRSQADTDKQKIREEGRQAEAEARIATEKEIAEQKAKVRLEVAGIDPEKSSAVDKAMELIFEQHKEAFMKMAEDELSKKKRTSLTEKEKEERQKEMERRKKKDKPVYKPLPGDDKVKTKPSKYTRTELAEEVREEMKESGKDEFIRAASKVSGVSKKIIEEVYDRGLAAWAGSHRPGATAQQWAKARVYSFLTGGKTQSTADKDLWDKHLEDKKTKKSSEFVAEINPEDEAYMEEARQYYDEIYADLSDEIAKGKTWKAPKEVAEEAQRALDAKKEYGDKVKGGTSVGWKRARQLANQEPISYNTIKRMKAFFDRHEKNQDPSEEKDKEWWTHASLVSWLIWGGNSGRAWAEKIIEEEENKK